MGNLASPLGLPINEGGTGVLCHWPSDALPQFRRDVPCTSKVPRGYTPGSGGFRLYADPDPPNPGKCVHGDIHKYALVLVEIGYWGIGRDWTGFGRLMGQCVGVRSWPVGACGALAPREER